MKKDKTGLWVIAFFVLMIFCFSVANADSALGRTDAAIKADNMTIDFLNAFTGDAVFTLNSEKITVDTLVVDSVFSFSGDVVVDSVYSGSGIEAVAEITGEQLTSTDDATIADDIGIGGDATVTGTVSAEQLTSTDDGTVADDFIVGGETTLSGGVTYNYTAVEDSAYTVLISDYIIDISHTDTDTVDVTIPTALIEAGKTFQIWDTEFNADTNYITINTEGAELINEAAADTIAVAGGKRWIWSDGTNWFSRE